MPVPEWLVDEKAEVAAAINSLPQIFGLRNFPMRKFRVNERSTYFSRSDNSVQIVFETLCEDGTWKDFMRSSWTAVIAGNHVVPVC